MPRNKAGSITEMDRILWKTDREDKANLAIIEKWYMDRCEVKDCSEVSAAAIIRAMAREFTQIIRSKKKV